jgi:hypothetical protein
METKRAVSSIPISSLGHYFSKVIQVKVNLKRSISASPFRGQSDGLSVNTESGKGQKHMTACAFPNRLGELRQ